MRGLVTAVVNAGIATVLALGQAVVTSAGDWTPVQIEIGPESWSLCKETTDVFGLRLAVVGKNRNVYGFDLCLDSAVADGDCGGLQVAAFGNVTNRVTGLQLGVVHAKAGTQCRGLQASIAWSETRSLCGGQMAVFNEVEAGAGFQLGLYNQVEAEFSGVSVSAVSIAQSAAPAAQVSLFFNRTKAPSAGLQFAVVDFAGDYCGAQAGAYNDAENTSGAQAGVYNEADNASGLQFGIVSVAHSIRGLQVDLLGSGAFEVQGLQVGAVNIAGRDGQLNGEVAGAEIGLVNRVGALRGLQAGGLNDARSCHGAQFGLVNHAGELHGVQLGLLNLSGRGGLRVSPLVNAAF